MERQYPSIFNDILGPVMVGPSSSHTCAPSRIGYTCQQLLHGKLKKVVIEFAREGAYTLSYQGQRSDMGFINGLLGNRPEDPVLRNAYSELEKSGIDLKFVISDFPPIRPNISHITLESEGGEHVVVHTDSTGAGTFRIMQIDGHDVDIVGDCYELLVRADLTVASTVELNYELNNLFPVKESISISMVRQRALINVKLRYSCPDDLLQQIKALKGVTDVLQLKPILTVLSNRHATMPFRSAEEMLTLAEKEGKDLAELAVIYEQARSGMSREEIYGQIQHIIDIMENSALQALEHEMDMKGILPASGRTVQQYMQNHKFLDMA